MKKDAGPARSSDPHHGAHRTILADAPFGARHQYRLCAFKNLAVQGDGFGRSSSLTQRVDQIVKWLTSNAVNRRAYLRFLRLVSDRPSSA